MYKILQAEHIDPAIEAKPNFISSIGKASPLHCHDFYEFFLITEGRCLHRANGRDQRLSMGALVFIRPDDSHCYAYDGGGECSFINLACSRSIIEGAFSYLGANSLLIQLEDAPMPPFTVLSATDREAFVADFERLGALATIDKRLANMKLRAMLADVIGRYFYGAGQEEANRMPPWFEALITQMQRKENFSVGFGQMIALSGHSKGHVSRLFRQYLDATPTDYMNSLRLNYAKSLLLLTRLSIMDVAMDSGFGNLSHFNHLFKKQTGETPSAYRKIYTGL